MHLEILGILSLILDYTLLHSGITIYQGLLYYTQCYHRQIKPRLVHILKEAFYYFAMFCKHFPIFINSCSHRALISTVIYKYGSETPGNQYLDSFFTTEVTRKSKKKKKIEGNSSRGPQTVVSQTSSRSI